MLSELTEEEVNKKIDLMRSELEWLKSECELVPAVAKADPDDAFSRFHREEGGRVGRGFDEQQLKKLFDECELRYAEEIPPGYKDKNKHPNPTKTSELRSNFGDFLFWRQTMDWSKAEAKDVILITDDQKEDWWLQVSGKTVSARPELIAEFCEETGRQILFYNPDRFLQLAKEKLNSNVSDSTITEIREEHDTRSVSKKSALRAHNGDRRKLWKSISSCLETLIQRIQT